jgi:hypothetical protein
VIAAVTVLALVCAALMVALDRARRGTERLILDLEKRHRDERSELADRIQRPEFLPLRPVRTGPREPKDSKDAEAFARVGTVVPIRDDTDNDGGPGSNGAA